jgi:hypothetical protein
MADITIYKNVRFANRIDTEANWVDADPVLEPGEIAFVGQAGYYYMVVGCEHKTSMANIVLNPEGHASHIFYPSSGNSGGGGGGGGGGGSIPIATDATIGGVKVSNSLISGLMLEEDGTLSNALISGYDAVEDRFIIDRLHIKNLSFDQQSSNLSASGNYITVRAEADGGMGSEDVAGLVVENITGENYNGFLGINRNNQIVIRYLGSPITGAVVAGVGAGYIFAEEGIPYATIVPFEPLTFVDGENTIQYTPNNPGTSITLTPPAIKINGQATSYDAGLREYNILLDGGLTPENAAKLEQFDNYIAIIDNLNAKHINAVEGDETHISAEMIANGELGQKIKVTHNNIECTNENSNRRYTIQSSSDPNAEGITVITGITLDSKGHVTGLSTANIAWVI